MFLLLVTLHKFSRVRPRTIFSFAIILICYLLAAMFVMLLLTCFVVRCLSQHKAAMICHRLFERELCSSGGHPGEAMGKCRRHAVRALSGLPRKVSCLQRRVSAMPTVTQRLNIVKSSCCVTPSYALCSFQHTSEHPCDELLRRQLYCGESARHTIRKCNF